MATYYNNSSLSPIQTGGRFVTSADPYTTTTELGGQTPSANSPSNGIVSDHLLTSMRQSSTGSHIATGVLARAVSTEHQYANRVHKIFDTYGYGAREQVMKADELILEQRLYGKRIEPTPTGVSVVGIGYEPVIIDRGDKKIRRWPREWHGDNMTN